MKKIFLFLLIGIFASCSNRDVNIRCCIGQYIDEDYSQITIAERSIVDTILVKDVWYDEYIINQMELFTCNAEIKTMKMIRDIYYANLREENNEYLYEKTDYAIKQAEEEKTNLEAEQLSLELNQRRADSSVMYVVHKVLYKAPHSSGLIYILDDLDGTYCVVKRSTNNQYLWVLDNIPLHYICH